MIKKLLLFSIQIAICLSAFGQAIDAGRTTGSLDVSSSGAATYNVPIAAPPGINGVVPQIALTYSSQGGNGLAGYGWNVSGLSSISRIPSTRYHDNYISGVNFDSNDRFALDGQRLILKSGTYGGNGAVYETESKSNIKVVSIGVSPYGSAYGPASFEVYYPDGSKAFYGLTTDSRSRTDFALSYTENAQQIRITYAYTITDNTSTISNIKYGTKGATQGINQINFTYGTRTRKEQGYTGGEPFYQSKILTEIQVLGNGTPYRKYELTHNTVADMDYQRVTKIQEISGDDSKAFEPIDFTYTNTNSVIATPTITNIGLGNLKYTNSSVLTGEFSGDGKMDFILYPTAKDKLWVYKKGSGSSFTQSPQINTGTFRAILPVTHLTSLNKVGGSQGFVLVKRVDPTTMKFEVKSIGTSTTPVDEYERQWNPPLKGGYYSCIAPHPYVPGTAIDMEYLTGDFNGDGLTDVLAVDKPYSYVKYQQPRPEPCQGDEQLCCLPEYIQSDGYGVYFINLDRRITSNFATSAGGLNMGYANGDRLFAADFNGDGKTDIVHNKAGNMYVYGLNANNVLVLLWQTSDSHIGTNPGYQPLLGDFNGDGKTDIIFPHLAWYYSSPYQFAWVGVNNNMAWSVFMSTGTSFAPVALPTYPFANVIVNEYNGMVLQVNYVTSDINGDGKTDIVRYTSRTDDGQTNGTMSIHSFINMGASGATAPPMFVAGPSVPSYTTDLVHYPIPVFMDTDKPNYNLEFGLISNWSITSFAFQKDLRKETLLQSASQDGVDYAIHYQGLDRTENNPLEIGYEAGGDQVYPYVNLQTVPDFKVVDKLTRSFNNTDVIRLFGYREPVSHAEGLGFMGFTSLIRSTWLVGGGGDNNIWNRYTTDIYDPQKRGALVKQFTGKWAGIDQYVAAVNPPVPFITLSSSVTSNQADIASNTISLDPGFEATGTTATYSAEISNPENVVVDNGNLSNNYITRTDYTYDFEVQSNKVFINKLSSTNTKNLLSNTNTNINYTYDEYNNVLQEFTNLSGVGTKRVEVTYDNSIGATYYIGRPLIRKTTLTNGADTYTGEEQFTYTTGYLPTQVKKKGNNTAFITENLQYDTYGNITQKSVTAGSSTRTTQTEYDASGRFATKVTNVEGLETTFAYNAANGNMTSKTAPGNIISTYTYDVWGRPIQATDVTGLNTTTTYTKSGSNIIIEKTEQEVKTNTTVNAIGQNIEDKRRDMLGQWSKTVYEYDSYDRQIRKSEPVLSGSPTQWTQTEYDEYGRVKKITAHTGKNVDYSYSGLATTVNNGTKTVTTTKNALDNTISVQDPGGTVNYTYYANGNLKSADFAGSTQSMEQDGWGRKTKLTDPSAGDYTYTYNDFGETIQETTPKGTTTYTYNTVGKLTGKTIVGDNTNIGYTFSYHVTTKLLTGVTLSNADGNNTNYAYTYDSYRRTSSTTEDNAHAIFTKTFTYDTYSRILTEESSAKNKRTNRTVTKKIRNTYQNGLLKSFKDDVTNEKIWESTAINARGQATTTLLGATMRQTDVYDTYGYPQEFKTEKIVSTPVELMKLNYSFNATRGNLTSRSNTAFSPTWSETFTYDSQDRLLSFNDNNGAKTQTYDNRGRITNNSVLGDYTFNGNSYQQSGLTPLTTGGNTYYKDDRKLQQISYNAFKGPVDISEQGRDKMSFQYNGAQTRSHMYYGDEEDEKMDRRFRRHYSEDGTMEITEDMQAQTTSFVFYMGGDAYNSPALWKAKYNSSLISEGLYYLFRDYLNSINLITDNQGVIKEKRQFDAWGAIVKLTDGSGNDLSALLTADRGYLITDRGYTGHEHLWGVDLIHMNGRLYDPKLHRFLSPDNYVQDPTNTQNFNRYTYVLNNPLKYTDPNGEVIVEILIGAGIGILTNGIANVLADRPFFQGFIKAAIIGAVGGAFSVGIGNAANTLTGFAKFSFQTLAHAYLGGMLTGVSGGNYWSGFLSGAFASMAAAGTLEILEKATGVWAAAGTVASGALTGGIGSVIGGDGFWDGVRNGAISAGLNHVHGLFQRKGGDYLVYDGDELIWYDSKGNVLARYPATSGGENYQNSSYVKKKDVGPLPEGDYTLENLNLDPNRWVEQNPNHTTKPGHGIESLPPGSDDWGTMRARLTPAPGTKIWGRDNTFYVHNSHKGYTHGCIEVGKGFFNRLVNYAKTHLSIKVVVAYPSPNSTTLGNTYYK